MEEWSLVVGGAGRVWSQLVVGGAGRVWSQLVVGGAEDLESSCHHPVAL